MSFRISATTRDGETAWTTRLQDTSAMQVADRWREEGRSDVTITDPSGHRYGTEEFRTRLRRVRALGPFVLPFRPDP